MKMRLAIIALASVALVAGCDKGSKAPQGKAVQPAQPAGQATNNKAAAPTAGTKGEKAEGAAKAAARGAKVAPKNVRPVKAVKNLKAAPKAGQPNAAQKAAAQKMAFPVKGAKDAKVYIVEFSDFQCPFCGRVEGTIKKIMDTYKGDVKFAFLHQPLPFHQNAHRAAVAAVAAQKQGKFWELHDKMYANQRALSDADILKYAGQVGLDLNKFKADLKDPVIAAFVNRNRGIAGAVKATGTPAFFINGKSLKGAQPFERFKAVIDEEIKAAKDAGKSGDAWTKARMKAANPTLTAYIYDGKVPPAVPTAAARKRQPRPVDKTVYKVTFDAKKDPVKGDLNKALVTLVLFSDFQCPFCGRLNPTLAKIHETYGDKVALVFKQNPLPFHKNAQGAAEAAVCAQRQGKFWEMHDKMFANQRALAADNLAAYAQEVGVKNMAAWKGCVESHAAKAQIDADQEEAGKVTARGTPNTFVNGRKMTGAKPFEEFKKLIDEELKKAQAIADKGTPINQVYAQIIKNGKLFEPLDAKVNEFKIEKNTAIQGSPKAKIQITLISDFQCPFCSRVVKPLDEVVKHYGKDIALTFKNFPLSFHKSALPAAKAALCANKEGKFWPFHHLVYENQKQLKDATIDTYVGWAKQAGVKKLDAFKKCAQSDEMKAQIDAEMAEGRKAGVRGTPTIYINGRKFTSPTGYNLPAFTKVIDKYILKKG